MSYGEENEVLLAKWLAGEVTDQEIRDALGDEELQKYQKLIKGVDNLGLEEYNTEEQFEAVKKRINRSKSAEPRIIAMKRFMPYVAAAASVLLMVVFYFLFPKNQEGQYLTGVGEQLTIELPDGSVVQLNANSSLELDESSFDDARNLKLEGEAFFKVQKGTPFTVSTSQFEVRVLGTSFNVKDRSIGSFVNCYTGKVSVGFEEGSSADQVLLTAGNGVAVSANKQPVSTQFTPADVPSWVNGISRFDGALLNEVMDELTNQYGIEFQYKELPEKAQFSGSFVHDDLPSALDMVFGAMEIEYIVSDNNTVILR